MSQQPETITRVTLYCDTPQSWIASWVKALQARLAPRHDVRTAWTLKQLALGGDICFLLGCTKVLSPEALACHRMNLVVHESRLPQGRGFSPIAWQVLQGAQEIPVTLLEATPQADAGPVHFVDAIHLDGTELLPEIRQLQGAKTVEMVERFLAAYPDMAPQPQQGSPTFFRRRTRKDDQLDPCASLAAQFDHLRIVDNERYPAWFQWRNKRYLLHILPMEDDTSPSAGTEKETPGVDSPC